MRHSMFGMLGFAACVLSHPLSAQSPVAADGSAVLSPGDAVRITVWRKPELSGEYVIASDGSVTHPLYRSVKVAGLPFGTAEQRVHSFLERFEASPQFVMEPLLRVSVGGEVARPNLYTLRPETSIAQAVALAGGLSERGRRERVRVLRSGAMLVADLTRPEAGLAQTPIRSGDEIFVERRRAIFREYITPAFTVIGAVASIFIAVQRSKR